MFRFFGFQSLICLLMIELRACAPTDGDEPLSADAGSHGIADHYRATAQRITAKAIEDHVAFEKLEVLCDDVGHRLSGSPQLERAIEWATETLRRESHDNVHTEQVMVPHWVRGAESLAVLSPREESIPMLGLGGSVGTPPDGITAPVIVVADEDELEAVGSGAAGHIVLFNNPMPAYDPVKGSGYGTMVRFRTGGAKLASESGAVACLVRSVTATSLRSPHTGAMRYDDAKVRIPAAAISVEDADRMARWQARGTRPVVRLVMGAQTQGTAPSANVIAELRGSTHPEEIVIIGGHIDSWDVGQGAHDDGAGCVMAMEALNVLRKLDLVPRRTIRLVLWTNEENGLAGARQYARDHAAEIERHVAGIEADSGGFRPTGFSVACGDEEKQTIAARQLEDIVSLFAALGADSVTTGWAGADLSPLEETSVVRMAHRCEGSRYFDYHHSAADTLDKVSADDLARNVAVLATTAYILADIPTPIGQISVPGSH